MPQINKFISTVSVDLAEYDWDFIEQINATKDFDAAGEASMKAYIEDQVEFVKTLVA